MSYLGWYRDRIARLEHQVEQWRATAAGLQKENGELRRQLRDAQVALANMHTACTEQQAEIARLNAVERSAFIADL